MAKQQIELNQSLKRIQETGKIELGFNSARNNLLSGKAKLVIITQNTPREISTDLRHYAQLAETPMLEFPGTAMELGELLGRPFLVGSMTVLNPGTVNIKQLTKA
ncbi:MAG: 50S ribosomal protein L30e [DPANN group archaeon]|nr:50S ribosomal protein L30e [DPANN group archaeon]